ncbi:MAG TPA: cation:dicarboxylase symporter family transporter, partial [Bryobacteraceae bacterium]|nr:cation:dicarboxylase symporter family transporter [Bryobacteraceae bacterium]
MKRLSLTGWIFIAMVIGIVLGAFYPGVAKADWMLALANVFLRLIKSIIAPLIFGTLVYGIAGTGSIKTMGRIGVKALVYFEVLTTLALFIGVIAVNLVRPGEGLTLEAAQAGAAVSQPPPTFGGVLEHTFPASVIDAMARGDVLQIVVFSFLFGAACAAIGDKAKPVVSFCHSLADVMLRYTKYVMYLAPVGVGAAMAHAIGTNGVGVLLGLGKLVLTLYVSLILFIVLFLGASAILARVPLGPFLRAVREPSIIAFSTASSEAALPLALENMEAIGAPPHIVAFV